MVARSSRAGDAIFFSMREIPSEAKLIHMLLNRLERISVDSVWAHRASGLRGSLLHAIEKIEQGDPLDSPSFKSLFKSGFHILQKAAQEKR